MQEDRERHLKLLAMQTLRLNHDHGMPTQELLNNVMRMPAPVTNSNSSCHLLTFLFHHFIVHNSLCWTCVLV